MISWGSLLIAGSILVVAIALLALWVRVRRIEKKYQYQRV